MLNSSDKHISETYKKRFGMESHIIFKNSFLESKDITGEAKINYSVFREIIEISTYYIVNLETGGTLIIAKEYITDSTELNVFLKDLSNKLEIEYKTDVDWKWQFFYSDVLKSTKKDFNGISSSVLYPFSNRI